MDMVKVFKSTVAGIDDPDEYLYLTLLCRLCWARREHSDHSGLHAGLRKSCDRPCLTGECCAHKAMWNCAALAAIAESSLESVTCKRKNIT